MWPLLSSSQQLGSFEKASAPPGAPWPLWRSQSAPLSPQPECPGVALTDSLERLSFFFEPGLCRELCSASSVSASSAGPGRAPGRRLQPPGSPGCGVLLLPPGLTRRLVAHRPARPRRPHVRDVASSAPAALSLLTPTCALRQQSPLWSLLSSLLCPSPSQGLLCSRVRRDPLVQGEHLPGL